MCGLLTQLRLWITSARPAGLIARHRGIPPGMLFISKRSGQRANVRFMPGCLLWSLLLSVGLTILLNVAIRAF